MERMQAEANELQRGRDRRRTDRERSHGWGSHVIEFFAIGNGVVPIRDDHEIEKPGLVLPLTG